MDEWQIQIKINFLLLCHFDEGDSSDSEQAKQIA